MEGQQVLSDFLEHPSHHQVVSFFLGFVFISSIHFTIHLPLAAVRRLHRLVLGRGPSDRATTRGSGGLEANRPLGDDKVHRWLGNRRASNPTTSSIQSRPKSNNLALSLTLCLGMASVANFGSLLLFDRGGLAGCAFLVAWGGMAAQSARLLGLLKLSLDLRKLGVPRWESFLFWGCLIVAVVFMFASNAVGIGMIRPLLDGPWALCYRKHFLSLEVATSSLDIILEIYSVIRIYFLIAPAFLSSRHKLDALLDVRTSRALSLLILDLAAAVPAAHFFNVLADFIPATIGELIVLAAFNQKSPDVRLASTASIPGTRPESVHSRSTIEIKKMPSSQSLADPHQRISHPFAASALLDTSPETEDWPESASPRDPEKPQIAFPESEPAPAPRSRWQMRRVSDYSVSSDADSDVARSVRGAVVGFAFKDVGGSGRRQRSSFLSAPENLTTARAALLPMTTPLRVPRPVVPPQSLHVEALERASRYERNLPLSTTPSPTSLTPPQIAITAATPTFPRPTVPSPSSFSSSRPSISISVPSNVGSNGSNESTKSSLHLTPSTPAPSQSQASRRGSSDESDWRYDARYDARFDTLRDSYNSSHPSSEDAPSLLLVSLQQRNSGGSARLPPADDDLSIVYEASHEESESVPPSRAHRPTFGEHMFVEGGIGRPISTPVGVPEDVREEGAHSNNTSPSSGGSKRQARGEKDM